MKLELPCSNAPDNEAAVGVLPAISAHRRKMCDLVNFARDCDSRRNTDSLSAMRMERLSEEEQSALTVVAEAAVLSAGDRRAKAMYLAELIDADAECLRPEDLVAAFRSLA